MRSHTVVSPVRELEKGVFRTMPFLEFVIEEGEML